MEQKVLQELVGLIGKESAIEALNEKKLACDLKAEGLRDSIGRMQAELETAENEASSLDNDIRAVEDMEGPGEAQESAKPEEEPEEPKAARRRGRPRKAAGKAQGEPEPKEDGAELAKVDRLELISSIVNKALRGSSMKLLKLHETVKEALRRKGVDAKGYHFALRGILTRGPYKIRKDVVSIKD